MLYGVCIIIAVQAINGKVQNIFVRLSEVAQPDMIIGDAVLYSHRGADSS
jgi:hypothetical protein